MLSGLDRAGMEKTRLDDMGLLKGDEWVYGFHSIFQGFPRQAWHHHHLITLRHPARSLHNLILYIIPILLKMYGLFFHYLFLHVSIYLLVYVFVYVYDVYTHIFLNILLHLYNTCVYAFSTDYMALDNQLVCSFWGKTTSSAANFPYLPMVLCAGLRLHGLFLFLRKSFTIWSIGWLWTV